MPDRGDFTLTVYGAGFATGAVVNWNGTPRSTTFVSARELQAQILASDVAHPTAGYITVTNPAPGGGNSSSSYGLVEVHMPTASIVPGQPHYYELGFDAIEFVVAADFSGDGKLDLLGGAGSGKVYLLPGKGDGTFGHTSVVGHRYYDGGCDYMNTLAVGDFNNDGKLDFVFPAGFRQPPVSIEVRLSNGDGTFRTSSRFRTFDTCPDFAVGDFNGDGRLDLAAAVPSDSAVHIFLGNGDGTFRQGASYGSLPGVASPVVADFDGDGKLDLVVDTTGTGLLLLLGNGDGTFQSPQTIIASKQGLGCGFGVPFLVNDFNGDGKMDLAFCSLATAQMGVVLGNGDGTFKKPVYYHAGSSDTTWAFTAGDFNSDGKTDFIDWYFKDGFSNPTFAILKGKGDGTFERETAVKLPGNIEELGIVPGDFNSDGLLDFIMIPGAGGVEAYTQK
ncbi:MAG TPA: VCBS repeat-containing protein [Terriglobales bacterium]|nr:VCBS repeat-containing protein [Terriglobales bacterium]